MLIHLFFSFLCGSVAAVGPKMQIDLGKMFGGAVSGASATLGRPGLSTRRVQGAGVRPGDKVGILFLNLGGPESLDEVEDFLFNLFNDEDIIRLPNVLKALQRKCSCFLLLLGNPRA